jgi:adenine-specific DNA-methyltransferase
MHTEVGTTGAAKAQLTAFFPGETPFSTPKPEQLIERVIQIASNEGDLVLDSFAGSGTTGAVAHKMGRRWIMVEIGEHCHTHIIPRLKKVIDGEDQGGISKAVNWKGGGGFRYYHLGPSLIVEDQWGNPVINPEFNAAMLAEAMCKLEGFTFAPNPELYWQHGRSSETDFIYVTTQMLTGEMLTQLSDEVGPHRSLLICCSAFRGDASAFENLTVKKIPNAVLRKCEWGHDDYSLEIRSLPAATKTENRQDAKVAKEQEMKGFPRRIGKGKAKDTGPTLFDEEAI